MRYSIPVKNIIFKIGHRNKLQVDFKQQISNKQMYSKYLKICMCESVQDLFQ